MTMTPTAQAAQIEPVLLLTDAAFDELARDLEAPRRPSPLRDLL